MQTYGIYAVSPKGANIRDDKDNGWVGDFKWGFSRGVKPERRLGLEHIPVLKGAARDGGKIRLEVTPMLEGQPLAPVLLPVTLRGNITIDEDGDVNCTTRLTFGAMETAGLGVDAILGATCCLECTVSSQPTLDEQVREERAQPGEGLAAQEALPFGDVAPAQDVPANVTLLLTPREPGEDLPFPLDGDSSTQPSA